MEKIAKSVNNGILSPEETNNKKFRSGLEAINFYLFNRQRLSNLQNARIKTNRDGRLSWTDLAVWTSVFMAKERTLKNETRYKYKESFKLFYLQKLDVEEICKEVGLRKSSVYKYAYRVLEDFEKELIKAGLLDEQERTKRSY